MRLTQIESRTLRAGCASTHGLSHDLFECGSHPHVRSGAELVCLGCAPNTALREASVERVKKHRWSATFDLKPVSGWE